jgi:hypothetical protein
MGVKRYIASQDATITNAFKENLTARAVSSNMGASDILETFVLYAQSTTSSLEASRFLLDFPVTSIAADRTSGAIPASGSVSFYLKLSNAPHGETLPKDFELVVEPVSSSWIEGHGQDMEKYADAGVVNWLSASSGSAWTTDGGDYLSTPVYTASFGLGSEDLELDISFLVEGWLSGTIASNGVGVRFPDADESGSLSFFTKRFFARRSEHFYKRPWIEARYDSSVKDNRNSFYLSSSLVPAADNLMSLLIYNRTPRGLRNIPSVGTGSIYVSIHAGSATPIEPPLLLQGDVLTVTGSWVETGVYTADVAVYTTSSLIYDVWHNNLTASARVEFLTGSAISVIDYSIADQNELSEYVLKITNMKARYSNQENARFRLFTRDKDWSPTIYTVAISDIENNTIENAYYKISRVIDNFDVIPYGTGSDAQTLMSYDKDGNYFDLDMSVLETGYQYEIGVAFDQDGEIREQREVFRFRVD